MTRVDAVTNGSLGYLYYPNWDMGVLRRVTGHERGSRRPSFGPASKLRRLLPLCQYLLPAEVAVETKKSSTSPRPSLPRLSAGGGVSEVNKAQFSGGVHPYEWDDRQRSSCCPALMSVTFEDTITFTVRSSTTRAEEATE